MNTVSKKEACFVSVADYLAHYACDDNHRYELIDNEVHMMGSTSKVHNTLTLALNLTILLRSHLKGKPCQAYMECLKVNVGHNYFFPDVAVDCDNNDDKYTLTKPVLLVEVLFNSTRRHDRVLKRHEYQKIPSLQEYVLIEQDFKEITVFRRNKSWQSDIYYENEHFYLASVDLTVMVNDVYEDVEFDDA